MTDHLGSDTQLPAIALALIARRIAEERLRWAIEQALVEMQPILDDPGDDHPVGITRAP